MKENKNEKLNIISENFSFDLDAILEEYRSFGSSVPAPQSAFSDADYTYRTESGDSFFASYTSGNEFVPEEFVPESSGDYSFSPAAAQEPDGSASADFEFDSFDTFSARYPDEDDPSIPAASGYVRPQVSKDDEIRAYVESFTRDFLDLKDEPVNEPASKLEVDSRFLMAEDYRKPKKAMYNGVAIDTSADESYTPAASAVPFVSSYAPDEELPAAPEEEAGDESFEASLDELTDEAEPAGDEDTRSTGPVPLMNRLRFGHRAKRRDVSLDTDEADTYDPALDQLGPEDFSAQEDYFPSSFREYVFSLVTSIIYRFRTAKPVMLKDEPEEDLGPEMSVTAASKYYGKFLRSMRLRVRIAAVLLVVLLWISLGLPVTGMLKLNYVAAPMCLSIQLAILLLCLDCVTNAILKIFRLKPGIDSLAVVACLLTSLDAVLAAKASFTVSHLPLCALSSLSLLGVQLSSYLSCKSLRKSLRVPAISKHSYSVTCESIPGQKTVTILKSVRPYHGFVHRSEESAPDEVFFGKMVLPLAVLAVLFALIAAAATKSFGDLVFLLSLFFCAAVPFSALLCFALPFFVGTHRIFPDGAAIAGWSGACDIGTSRDLIVTDRDIFPEGNVEVDSARVFGDSEPERIIAYAGSLLTASGSGVAACFDKLMTDNHCRMRMVESIEYLSGGGIRGVIESNVVLCGSVEFMQLMNVKVPFRLVGRTSVLLAINGMLYGIFNIKYTGDPEVRRALLNLIRSNRHPVFAIRDFNVTPSLLHDIFDIATDGYDFPPYVDRFDISSASDDRDVKISAVVGKEGLGPLVSAADTARSIYVVSRINIGICMAGAVFLMFYALISILGAGAVSIGSLLGMSFLFLLPILAVSSLFRI